MKRLRGIILGLAIGALATGPGALATDGTSGTSGPAMLDAETDQLFDSQDPPHTICINGTCQTATGHGTATFTVTMSATATGTHSHLIRTPFGAEKTLVQNGTVSITATDIASEWPGAGRIALSGTDSKIGIAWLPTGTATNSVVTGADPRLTDARVSTNTLYQGSTNVSFSTGTSTVTTTSAAVADNPKIHVAASTATATGTHAHTIAMPYATKTVAGGGTVTITETDIATTTAAPGKIPRAGTGNEIASTWVPWAGISGSGVVSTGDNLYDLGSSTKRWNDLHLGGSLYATGGSISGPSLGYLYIGVPPSTNLTLDFNGNVTVGGGISASNITATPTGNAIPKADASGTLDAWVTGDRFGRSATISSPLTVASGTWTSLYSGSDTATGRLLTISASVYMTRYSGDSTTGCGITLVHNGSQMTHSTNGWVALSSGTFGSTAHIVGRANVTVGATQTWEVQGYGVDGRCVVPQGTTYLTMHFDFEQRP